IFGHVYDQCPKNVTAIPIVDMTNDGFQTVVNKRRSGIIGSTNTNRSSVNVAKTAWQPIKLKVGFEPKVHGYSPRNGAPNVSTFAKDGSNSVHTSSKKQLAKAVDIPQFDPESYTRSGGDVQDDMESVEEVEVVFDETTNLLSSTITGTSTYTAPVVSKN
ncbi:hypothetical protein Tco_0383437, partial [Tanacetum coccineum]